MALPALSGLALPILKGIAMNVVKDLVTYVTSDGFKSALTALVQQLGTSQLGNNINVAKNPPLGPFGRVTNFLDSSANSISDLAKRLQDIANRLRSVSGALTNFEQALKLLMDAITGRVRVGNPDYCTILPYPMPGDKLEHPMHGRRLISLPPTPSLPEVPFVYDSKGGFGFVDGPRFFEEMKRYSGQLRDYLDAVNRVLADNGMPTISLRRPMPSLPSRNPSDYEVLQYLSAIVDIRNELAQAIGNLMGGRPSTPVPTPDIPTPRVDILYGLPPKPTMPGPGASDEERLMYQVRMEEYYSALRQAIRGIMERLVPIPDAILPTPPTPRPTPRTPMPMPRPQPPHSDLAKQYGLPPKPTMPGPGASDEERLKYQEEMQNYRFALQQALNAITEEGATKSNLQKAAHDAIMQAISNLR